MFLTYRTTLKHISDSYIVGALPTPINPWRENMSQVGFERLPPPQLILLTTQARFSWRKILIYKNTTLWVAYKYEPISHRHHMKDHWSNECGCA